MVIWYVYTTTQEDIILYKTDSNFKCTWLTTDTKDNVYVSSPSGGIKRINSEGGNLYLRFPIKGEIISLNFTPVRDILLYPPN